jgi:hypothetical protein
MGFIAVFLKMALNTVPVRDVMGISMAFLTQHLRQQVGSFLPGGGVSGSRNLGVGEGGVGVAVDKDGGGASYAGNIGIVEGDEALTGKGESAIISGDGCVGSV